MKIEWLFPYAQTRIGEGRQAEAVIVPFPSAHHRFCWHEDALEEPSTGQVFLFSDML